MSSFSRRRAGALAVLGVVTTLALTACSSTGDDTTASSQQSTATPPTTPSSAPTTAGTTAPPAEPPPSPAGPATCRAADLTVRYADDAGGGAAGSTYGDLVLTNASGTACAMTGWPGVSYVGGGDGTQLGAAADRTGTADVIVLAAGQRATAQLREVRAGTIGGTCSSAQADGLRIYPPNSTTAVFVKHPTQACRSTSAHLLSVGPVRAG